MNKIKDQSSRVSQLVFSADTGATYKKTLTLTWDILRETGVLLWLIFCLLFVGIDWFYRFSVDLGQKARTWYDGLGKRAPEAEADSINSTGKAILGAGQSGVSFLLSQARQQLGMPEPSAPAPEPKSAPAPPTAAPPTAAPEPTASAPPAPAPVAPEPVAPPTEDAVTGEISADPVDNEED